MQKINDIKNLLAALETDCIKFYERGNHAAGTRIRKGMQDLKKMANAVRIEIQEKKRADEPPQAQL